MRCSCLVFSACVLLSTGCAGLLSECGKDITKLTNRDDVHAQFGEPIASGVENAKVGHEYAVWEEFHAQEIIANPYRGPGYGMGFMMSFGLSELIFVPMELTRLTKAMLIGEDLRFSYDEAGRVSYATIDGNPHYILCWRGQYRQRKNAQDP